MAENFYIQGNAVRANEIKAAFEIKGFDTTGNSFILERNLYFSINGKVRIASTEPFKSIIKTHPDYRELPLPVEPRFKAGQTVVFGGSVLTIHRIIEGYYLFNKEGSRGCRIDQQDKFIELKFKVGDGIRHTKTGVATKVVSIEGLYYRTRGGALIPIEEQDQWEIMVVPKFKVGDLVVYKDLIGRVNEVAWKDHFGYAYKVGDITGVLESDLRLADHRDEIRILKK